MNDSSNVSFWFFFVCWISLNELKWIHHLASWRWLSVRNAESCGYRVVCRVYRKPPPISRFHRIEAVDWRNELKDASKRWPVTGHLIPLNANPQALSSSTSFGFWVEDNRTLRLASSSAKSAFRQWTHPAVTFRFRDELAAEPLAASIRTQRTPDRAIKQLSTSVQQH